MAQTAQPAKVNEIKSFFGMTLPEMREEWAQGGLTKQDREDIALGIGDGSLTYPDHEAGA